MKFEKKIMARESPPPRDTHPDFSPLSLERVGG